MARADTVVALTFDDFCLNRLGLPPDRIRTSLGAWLEEDAGHGDATVRAMGSLAGVLASAGATPGATAGVAVPRRIRAAVVAKEPCVVAGLPLALETLRIVHGQAGWPATVGSVGGVAVECAVAEGHSVAAGTTLLRVTGSASALLLAERACLNLLARLCGIATYTAGVAERLAACQPAPGRRLPRLLETRKTTPGLKVLEKYATRAGGAANHRMGLDAGAMLKENHIRIGQAAGYDLRSLIDAVSAGLPLLCGLEVEVATLQEFEIALDSGAAVIMLDNFSLADAAGAVQLRDRRGSMALLEISGNLDRRPLQDIVAIGVDLMSMGALIHQARWTDLSMLFEAGAT